MEKSIKCHGYQKEEAHISLEDSRKALPMSQCQGKHFPFISAPTNGLCFLIEGWHMCTGRKEWPQDGGHYGAKQL